jgi:heme/copper-type cytochrome/quinol oxidase subunit 2
MSDSPDQAAHYHTLGPKFFISELVLDWKRGNKYLLFYFYRQSKKIFSSVVEFDSYIIPQEETNGFRLLDTDNRVTLPINSFIRIIVTAADVLHSSTVPRLGVKVDATPGRLNQTNFLINRPGLFCGQCSEICVANHRFIPIVIERISTNDFIE